MAGARPGRSASSLLAARLILAARPARRRSSGGRPRPRAGRRRVSATSRPRLGVPGPSRRPLGGGRDPLPGRAPAAGPPAARPAGRVVGRADLRAILAHELAHARGHDLAWNLAAHLASIVLWFHPLAWRIRPAHAAACDAVCDAVAADLLGDVAVVRPDARPAGPGVAGPPPAHGLAMARSSDVCRRLEALDGRSSGPRSPGGSSCPRSSLGSRDARGLDRRRLAVTRAEASARRTQAAGEARRQGRGTEARPAGSRLTGRRGRRTGEPLEGVSIVFQGRFDGKLRSGDASSPARTARPSSSGPAASKVEYLKLITARKPRFVPIYTSTGRRASGRSSCRRSQGAPARAGDDDRRRREGRGRQADRRGQGRASTCRRPSRRRRTTITRLGTPKTDAQGRWRLDDAPADLGRARRPGRAPRLPAGLRPGVARPRRRDRPQEGPDGQGAGVDPGQADRRGHGGHRPRHLGLGRRRRRRPTPGRVHPGELPRGRRSSRSRPTASRPSSGTSGSSERRPSRSSSGSSRVGTIRVRVVDARASRSPGPSSPPTPGAGTARSGSAVDTDAEGRFDWQDAPKDAVLYDIGQDGLHGPPSRPADRVGRRAGRHARPRAGHLRPGDRRRDRPAGAGVPRRPGLRFEGQRAGLLVAERGARSSPTAGTRSSSTSRVTRYFVRVEAAGYKPADSRAFRSDEGRTIVRLRPGAVRRALPGSSCCPTASRRPGPRSRWRPAGACVSLSAGGFGRNDNVPIVEDRPRRPVRVRPAGRPVPARRAGRRRVRRGLVGRVREVGQARPSRPWGKIEGRVRIGGKPGREPARSRSSRPGPIGAAGSTSSYGYDTRTDGRAGSPSTG